MTFTVLMNWTRNIFTMLDAFSWVLEWYLWNSERSKNVRSWKLTLEDRDNNDVEYDDGDGCKIDNGIGQGVASEPILAELLPVREFQVGYLKTTDRFQAINVYAIVLSYSKQKQFKSPYFSSGPSYQSW